MYNHICFYLGTLRLYTIDLDNFKLLGQAGISNELNVVICIKKCGHEMIKTCYRTLDRNKQSKFGTLVLIFHRKQESHSFNPHQNTAEKTTCHICSDNSTPNLNSNQIQSPKTELREGPRLGQKWLKLKA